MSSSFPKIVTTAAASPEHPRHSEAAVIQRDDGSLLLTWQEYVRSPLGSEDNAPNHLATMVSGDGGITWSDHRIVVEPDPGDVNVYSPCFVRLANGQILFFYFHYNRLEAGQPPVTSAFVRRSDDEGRTFSKPQAIWSNQSFAFASSGGRASCRRAIPESTFKVFRGQDLQRLPPD